MLRLTDVVAGYGPLQVLRRVNLEVRQGEIVCLLGGNAAGKSTTLKTVLGLAATERRQRRARRRAASTALATEDDRPRAASRWCPSRAGSSRA